jgi:alpha-N-acetylglucosaminidase
MIITLWGDQQGLHDYSNRQWAGLIKGFYKLRWEQFFNYVFHCHNIDEDVDVDAFWEHIKSWEREWVNSNEVFSTDATGDALEVSQKIFRKYFPDIAAAYNQ